MDRYIDNWLKVFFFYGPWLLFITVVVVVVIVVDVYVFFYFFVLFLPLSV